MNFRVIFNFLIGFYFFWLIFLPGFAYAENLSATCYADPLAAKVGQRIVWRVVPEGGSGFYQYSWSGDSNLFGNTSSVSKTYDSDGKKEATVVVSSGGETVTPTCEIEISEIDPPLSVSCFPQSSVVNISQEVTWIAESRGGDGKYEYSWNGDENLGGSNGRSGRRKTISKNYQTTGIKTANVIVSSGGQSSFRACNVTIEPDPVLTGVCYPNNQIASIGEPVVWTAEARGGSGEYKYSWSGTDNEKSLFRKRNKQAASSVYEIPGQKNVSVSIYSGNQSIVEICSVNIIAGAVLGVQNNGFSDSTYYTSDNNSYSNQEINNLVSYTSSDLENSNSELPTTSIFSFSWAVLFTLSSIFGAIVVFIFIIALNKNIGKKEEKNKLAFEKNGLEESISKIIQAEARKNGIMISFEALKVLVESSEDIPSLALKNLGQIIFEIKSLPIPNLPGEERWPTISKDVVDNFFLRKKTGFI